MKKSSSDKRKRPAPKGAGGKQTQVRMTTSVRTRGKVDKAAERQKAEKQAERKAKKIQKREGQPAPREPRVDDGRSLEVAMKAVNAALEKKALEPVLLDVRELASYTDYILIVSGRSDRQVDAVAQGIVESLKERLRPLSREGTRDGQWTLLDFGDVVVHVFYHQMRDYYDLESLWSDAPRVKLEIPPDSRANPEDFYEKSIVPGDQ